MGGAWGSYRFISIVAAAVFGNRLCDFAVLLLIEPNRDSVAAL